MHDGQSILCKFSTTLLPEIIDGYLTKIVFKLNRSRRFVEFSSLKYGLLENDPISDRIPKSTSRNIRNYS